MAAIAGVEIWVRVFREDLRKALSLFELREAKLGLFWQKKRGEFAFSCGVCGWVAVSEVCWALRGFPSLMD